MKESATSTEENHRGLTKILRIVALLSVLVSCPNTLPAIAQEGNVGLQANPPIASSEAIRTIRDAAVAAEAAEPAAPIEEAAPTGAVDPKLIAKTFLATAYSLKGQTASGISVRRGIIAADPRILPLGSVVRLHAGSYSGIYTVMDTGGSIRGQRIDVFLPTRAEAVRFGARRVKVEILRHGWEPSTASAETK